jgi:hypothetical protein
LLPTIHMQRIECLEGETEPTSETCLLVAEILLPMPGTLALSEARGTMLDILLAQFPFLQKHLVLVDSPHDGLPVWVYDNGVRRFGDRVEVRGAARGVEPMRPVLSVDPPGYRGMGGEPLRGPLANSFLTGASVLPSLGQEGELLAAWSVARIITGSDRRRARLRRDMWSRIEFG